MHRQQPIFRGKCKKSSKWHYGFGWFVTDYSNETLLKRQLQIQDAVLLTENGTVLCELHSMSQYIGVQTVDGLFLFEDDILVDHTSGTCYVIIKNDNGTYVYQKLHSGEEPLFYEDLKPLFKGGALLLLNHSPQSIIDREELVV